MTERRKTEWRGGVLLIAIVFGVLFCSAIVVGGLLVIGAIAFTDTDEENVLPHVVETSREFVCLRVFGICVRVSRVFRIE